VYKTSYALGQKKGAAVSIITISRGTFSGGKMLAECLCRSLGYRCIDRDVLVEKAAVGRVTQRELRAALEEPPAAPGRTNHRRYIYLALIQAALIEEVRTGEAIYHGLAGHLLLRGAPGLLRLRIIAPMEFRIRMAQDRFKLNRSDAVAYIEKMDQDRRKWTQFLYGVDWGDPSLYHLVINLEDVTIEQACLLIISMLEHRGFEFTPECQTAMNDLALASGVRAALALDPFTSNLEVDAVAAGGSVTIRGDLFEQLEDVRRVVLAAPGVTELSVEEGAAPAVR
jgi:cytidylate kinase